MSGASFHTADETGSNGQPRPPVTVSFEPRFCANHVVDLTAGCSFGCLYCPFAAIGARLRGVSRPTALDLSRLNDLTPPPSVFLSPARRLRRDRNLRLRVGPLSAAVAARAARGRVMPVADGAGADGGRDGVQRAAGAKARDLRFSRGGGERARPLVQHVRV